MAEGQERIEEIILARVLRMNATVQGLTTGVVVGLGVLVATNWLVLKGGDVVGPHLSLLSQYFIGYRVTFVGSLVGFAYGFVGGFIVGYLVARMYNWLVDWREGKVRQRA